MLKALTIIKKRNKLKTQEKVLSFEDKGFSAYGSHVI